FQPLDTKVTCQFGTETVSSLNTRADSHCQPPDSGDATPAGDWRVEEPAMRAHVLLILLIIPLLLAACGGAEATFSPPDPEATAEFEAAQATIVALRRGDATPIVYPTATPTVPPTPTRPIPTATPTVVPAEPVDLAQFFPTDEQLPPEFSIFDDLVITAEEVASDYPDPAAHLQRLEEWGFQGLVARWYQLPESLLVNDRMNIMSVGIYQYGSNEQAIAAVEWGIQDFRECGCFDHLGEPVFTPAWDRILSVSGRTIYGEENFNISRAYLIKNAIVIRVEGRAGEVDPTPEVDTFVQSVYGQQARASEAQRRIEG
ncbi:MAG: hypothetical protein ACRD1H_05195, partial [Vicinamibacterales bacterium]